MKVLVTGSAGFIGFHLCRSLLIDGFEVLGIDNINNYYDIKLKNARLDILTKFSNFIFKKIDIGDYRALSTAFNSFNPDRELKSQQNLWGLTFGIGLHMCFGRDLDGGVSPNQETDPSKHQYGVVTLLIKKLFEHNVQRDPKNKPERDIKTERPNWGKYPVIFGEKK